MFVSDNSKITGSLMWTNKSLLQILWKISIILKFYNFFIQKKPHIYNGNLLSVYIIETFNSPQCDLCKYGWPYLDLRWKDSLLKYFITLKK